MSEIMTKDCCLFLFKKILVDYDRSTPQHSFPEPVNRRWKVNEINEAVHFFASRYGPDVSYRFTKFLTRRAMFIGFTFFCGGRYKAKAPNDNIAIRGFPYALVEHESELAAHDRFVSAL